MKMTDGLFHKVFDEIGAEYPEIEKEHWIVDIGAAKLADTPEAFDVIVMPNLYGDILSDVAAQIAGSVGLAGSANIGNALRPCSRRFTVRLRGAPVRTWRIRPGLLLGGVMMLVHIGQWEVAERVHNAWLRTLEDGIHTYDIYAEGVSKQKVGTKEFAQAVVARLGQKPENTEGRSAMRGARQAKRKEWVPDPSRSSPKIEMVGVDLYVGSRESGRRRSLAMRCRKFRHDGLKLKMIDNRGTNVWPGGMSETFVTDNYRCRFRSGRQAGYARSGRRCFTSKVTAAGYDIVKTETSADLRWQAGLHARARPVTHGGASRTA